MGGNNIMSTLKDYTLASIVHEAYVPFDGPISNNPDIYGTVLPTGSAPFDIANSTNDRLIYEADVNPPNAPGGSWKMSFLASQGGPQIKSNTTNWPGIGTTIHDGEYYHSVWLKFNQLPTVNGFQIVYLAMRNYGFPGFRVNISGTDYGQGCNLYSNMTGGASTGILFLSDVQVDTWYHIVHRKTTATGDAHIFVNGVKVLTGSNEDTDPSDVYDFQYGATINANSTQQLSFNFCHQLTGNAIDLSDSAVLNLYNAGITPPAAVYDVKHYDGTAWQQSIGQKYWDGTDWVDWNAVAEPQRWDGAQWVNLL